MIEDREIEALARALGEGRAARVDPQRTAWAVTARLRREGVARPWWRRAQLVPVAAAAAAVLAVGLGVRALTHGRGEPGGFPVPVGVAGLGTDELTEVLDSMAWETPVSELVTPVLGDLSESELSALLTTMEG
jgi:hypothetical protein